MPAQSRLSILADFLLASRHHSYLLRCLPSVQRTTLKKQGISSSLLAWAFHSEAQDELLQLLPAFTKGKIFLQTWYSEQFLVLITL